MSIYNISSIFSTVQTYKEWKDNPIMTTVNTTAYPIKNIDFPAITICSQGASKDIMDVVLLKQFEEYLKSKAIIPNLLKVDLSKNRTKRSIYDGNNTALLLSKEEVYNR